MAFHILEDSNQKANQHTAKREYFTQVGAEIIRLRLPVGDYMVLPPVAVDTKQDIYEIANNIEHDHTRFRNECIKARTLGCRLIILIENEDGITCLDDLSGWRESDEHFRMRGGKRRIEGKRLAACMTTMNKRYGVEFMFCTPSEAGKRVVEILGGENQ